MPQKSDSFINDFINNIDQVNSEDDIVRLWQVHRKVAAKLYSLLKDILTDTVRASKPQENEYSDHSDDTDFSDSSTSDSDNDCDEDSDDYPHFMK